MSKSIVVTFILITQSEASVFNFSVFNGSLIEAPYQLVNSV